MITYHVVNSTKDEKEGAEESSINIVHPSLDTFLVKWKNLIDEVEYMASGDTDADTAFNIPLYHVQSIWPKTHTLLQFFFKLRDTPGGYVHWI